MITLENGFSFIFFVVWCLSLFFCLVQCLHNINEKLVLHLGLQSLLFFKGRNNKYWISSSAISRKTFRSGLTKVRKESAIHHRSIAYCRHVGCRSCKCDCEE